MASTIEQIADAFGYTPIADHPGIYLSKEGFPKTFMHETPEADKVPLADWFHARMIEIINEVLAAKAEEAKTNKRPQALFSIRTLAEEAADYPLSDDTVLGVERAYLFFCQLMATRPLGFNIPGFEAQVSHPPLQGDLKKKFSMALLSTVETALGALGTPEGHVWAASVAAQKGQFVRGRRDGAKHDTFNATVPLSEQNYEVVIRLDKTVTSKGVQSKGKAPTPKSKPAQQVAGGGGGPAPKTRKSPA